MLKAAVVLVCECQYELLFPHHMTFIKSPLAPHCELFPWTLEISSNDPHDVLEFASIISCTHYMNCGVMMLSKCWECILHFATCITSPLEATNSFWTLCTNDLWTSKYVQSQYRHTLHVSQELENVVSSHMLADS